MDNEAIIRNLYAVAENKDSGEIELFTEDGTFTDESIGSPIEDRRSRSWPCRAHTMDHYSCLWAPLLRPGRGWMPRAVTCFSSGGEKVQRVDCYLSR
jgi:hypothetical protein